MRFDKFDKFNENNKDRTKGHQLSTKQRKNIVRQAKTLIKKEVSNYQDLPLGKREAIQDKYIKQVCKERGFDFAHFYAEEGKKLDNILSAFESINKKI